LVSLQDFFEMFFRLKLFASESDAMRSVETEILYLDSINGSLMYRNPFTGNFDVACEQYAFELMWEVIHGRDSWQQNPWVWVIESLDHK